MAYTLEVVDTTGVAGETDMYMDIVWVDTTDNVNGVATIQLRHLGTRQILFSCCHSSDNCLLDTLLVVALFPGLA